MLRAVRLNIQPLLFTALLISGTGCFSYIVDTSSKEQFSLLINRCFITTKQLKIVRHERDRQFTELCPGNSGPGLTQLGMIEAGSKIILRRVTRHHIVSYGDLYHGIVEFEFQGKPFTAEAFTIFITKDGFAPNPIWLTACQ